MQLFVWPALLSQPLIGIHSLLIIHTEVGGCSKLSTQAPTEISLTANELFPYYICPSFSVQHMHPLIAHTVCTCISHTHNFLTLSRQSLEMWQGSAALSIIRVVKWRPHWPLGRGTKPRDIMIMEAV